MGMVIFIFSRFCKNYTCQNAKMNIDATVFWSDISNDINKRLMKGYIVEILNGLNNSEEPHFRGLRNLVKGLIWG